jgi:Mg2+-importing ATPase
MAQPLSILPKTLLAKSHQRRSIHVAQAVIDTVRLDADAVFAHLRTRPEGLTSAEAEARLAEYGPNVLAKDQRPRVLLLFWRAVVNPLVILLFILALISFLTGDPRAATMMVLMIALSVGLKILQEAKANRAAAELKAMISVRATVLRDGKSEELAISHLVPGDIVQLAAGDMIPGDVRIVRAKDLFVVQGSLTGEGFPVEKFVLEKAADVSAPLELSSIAFLGTSVGSGTATAVVVATGSDTYLGTMAAALDESGPPTAFDRGIASFTKLMLGFMAVMVPLVFVINGVTKGTWGEAFFFSIAVAVGLTPEMLPMIVTICLSKGAVAMGKKKVIVKHINAIQNLGAMDVLCVDKTGTLTRDEILLERYCDVRLRDSPDVLALAYTNSHFQTGLKNILDRAILAHEESHTHGRIAYHEKVDEVPFDFERRIMSVVVREGEGHDRLIAKGAPEAIFERCTSFRLDHERLSMDHPHIEELKIQYERLAADGFRVLAIATKDAPSRASLVGHAAAYGKADECELTLEGYVAFLDPPKESAAAAIDALQKHGVTVKVITGDNDLVAKMVCKQVGLATDHVLLGADVEGMTDDQLANVVEETSLFARVSPAHKQRIIKALKARNHTVGFMGDGINDAPALHAADVGISVDTAVDIAKESADMILLEKSLLVLDEGVLEGRRVFSNIVNYVRMGASSNFGNMFSVLGASVFVPFLPMRPIQILANNLLYDIGQTAIPTDAVDEERIQLPRTWDIKQLTRFILFIGPCSSMFDYSTYLLMLYTFKCWDVSTAAAAAHSESLFQTGWFVESLLTQTLIIHVIRTNKIPFLQSRPSPFLLATSGLIMVVGIALPFTPLGRALGFSALPLAYWPYVAFTVACYVLITQVVKTWLLRRAWIEVRAASGGVVDDGQFERLRLALALEIHAQRRCLLEGTQRRVGVFGALDGQAVDARDDVTGAKVDAPIAFDGLNLEAVEFFTLHDRVFVERNVLQEVTEPFGDRLFDLRTPQLRCGLRRGWGGRRRGDCRLWGLWLRRFCGGAASAGDGEGDQSSDRGGTH